MAIKRVSATLARTQELPYTTFLNSTIDLINDPDAMAIYAYLQTKSTNWIVRREDVMKKFGIGKHRYTKAMGYLRDIGLVEREVKRDKEGKVIDNQLVIHYQPEAKARSADSPDTGSVGNPDNRKSGESGHLESDQFTSNESSASNNSIAPSTDGACSECVGLGYHGLPEDKCNHCQGTGKEPPANPDQPSPSKAGSESDSNTDKGVRRNDKPNSYPDEFEWLWKHKPGRIGANPKKKAYSACKARLKSGSSWREMAEGMKRYTVHCQSEGKLNTQYVMQMATFFGPDEHFKEQWSVQQPQAYQAPGSEQTGVDAPIYPSQVKNFSSANQTEEGKQQNEKIRQGLGSLRSQLSGESK